MLLNTRKDFTFETVLSTDRNLDLLRQAKTLGYEIQAVFVLTNDPGINVERVKRLKFVAYLSLKPAKSSLLK